MAAKNLTVKAIKALKHPSAKAQFDYSWILHTMKNNALLVFQVPPQLGLSSGFAAIYSA
jgi:hypothetical protein